MGRGRRCNVLVKFWKAKVYRLVDMNPTISTTKIAKDLGISRTSALKWKEEAKRKIEEKIWEEYAGN